MLKTITQKFEMLKNLKTKEWLISLQSINEDAKNHNLSILKP